MLVYSYSRLIRIEDKSYPKYMSDVKKEYPNVSFPEVPDEKVLEDFKYALVHDSQVPSGDVVTEAAPELREDGYWYKTWTVRAFTPEEIAVRLSAAKEERKAEAQSILDQDKDLGVDYTYGNETHAVSLTDANVTMLLSLKALADLPEGSWASISENGESYKFRFSDGAIVNFPTTTPFLLMLNTVLNELYEIYQKFWDFISAVDSVENIDDIPEVPLTFK